MEIYLISLHATVIYDIILRVSNKLFNYFPCPIKVRANRPKGGVSQMSQTAKYEILYIIRPDLDEDSKKALVERFDGILTDNGAEISESKDWAKRRFAYEIKGYKEGTYHLVNLTSNNADAINEFERLARINDDILRHMVVRLDKQ